MKYWPKLKKKYGWYGWVANSGKSSEYRCGKNTAIVQEIDDKTAKHFDKENML